MDASPLWTPRLWLTPLTPPHADSWHALLHEPTVRRPLLDDALVGRQWVEEELRASDERFGAGGVGVYLAWLRVDGDFAGFVGLRPSGEPPLATLWCAVSPPLRRQGLAAEACAAVIERAFAGGVDAIHATAGAGDAAAAKLLERLGFARVQAAGDVLRFALPR